MPLSIQPTTPSSARSLPSPDALPVVSIDSLDSLERLDSLELRDANVTVDIVRLDQIDQQLGGNKWFKLLPFLHAARRLGQQTLVSFGGAYSNHIGALAAAGERYGFSTVGLIRGELAIPLNPVLHFAAGCGMTLYSVPRGDYRRRHESGFAEQLCRDRGLGADVGIIPEGGAALSGVVGCQRLADLLWPHLLASSRPCEILLPCGTGTTAAGLIAGLHLRAQHAERAPEVQVRGVAVLKGGEFLRTDIATWLSRQGVIDCVIPWCLEVDFHGGGYARTSPGLQTFVDDFGRCYGIPVEPVYSGKLLWAVVQRIQQGLYAPGTRIIVLHTGGIWTR